MTIGGAFLGGGAGNSIPAGKCQFIIQIMTEDRLSLSVATITVTDGLGHSYMATASADGSASLLVDASGQTYTVSVSTTGYDNTSSQTVIASSATSKYVRFELIKKKVNVAGDQTIEGHKTFSNDVQFGNGSGGIKVISPDGTKNASMEVKCGDDGVKYATAPHREYDASHSDDVVTNAVLASFVGAMYPVGSVYINASDSRNPHDIFGFGTWVSFGSGRVMVGLDSSDDDFKPIGKTGGEKVHTLTVEEMPAHGHTAENAGNHSHTIENAGDHVHSVLSSGFQEGDCAGFGNSGTKIGFGGPHNVQGGGSLYYERDTQGKSLMHKGGEHNHTIYSGGSHSHSIGNTGSGSAHNNLQPYVVVYMWKRTA